MVNLPAGVPLFDDSDSNDQEPGPNRQQHTLVKGELSKPQTATGLYAKESEASSVRGFAKNGLEPKEGLTATQDSTASKGPLQDTLKEAKLAVAPEDAKREAASKPPFNVWLQPDPE